MMWAMLMCMYSDCSKYHQVLMEEARGEKEHWPVNRRPRWDQSASAWMDSLELKCSPKSDRLQYWNLTTPFQRDAQHRIVAAPAL